MPLTAEYVRDALVALAANEFEEPQPIPLTEREAAILGIEAGTPGVVVIPDVRELPTGRPR